MVWPSQDLTNIRHASWGIELNECIINGSRWRLRIRIAQNHEPSSSMTISILAKFCCSSNFNILIRSNDQIQTSNNQYPYLKIQLKQNPNSMTYLNKEANFKIKSIFKTSIYLLVNIQWWYIPVDIAFCRF